jgi:hypothetical protein
MRRPRATGARCLLAAAALAILLPAPAAAAPGLREVAAVRLADPPAAELRFRGVLIARLEGATAWARVRTAARHLDRPFLRPAVVRVVARRGLAHVLVDGRVVLTADRRDAGAAGTGPDQLAARWAAALEQALAIAPIAVTPARVVLSPGFGAAVTLATPTPGPVVVGSFDRGVVNATVADGTLRLTGRRLGRTIVPVRLGPYRAEVAVSVLKPAGTIPRGIAVAVTGNPAPPDVIREAVRRHVQQAVTHDPGATMALGPVAVEAPLPPGATLVVPVVVGIRSPFAGPAAGQVRVTVANAPLPLADPEVLLISNRPETITGNGLLFQETLTAPRAARLLYHHMNGTAQARILKLTLRNRAASPARVHYVSGLAGPASDPVLIGHVATQRFLEALAGGVGYVVEVPPRRETTFTAYTLAPHALVSGLMQFQVIDGGPVDLTVHVRLPWLLDRTVTTDLGPWAFPHPRGTFPGAAVSVSVEVPAHQAVPLVDLGVASGLRDVNSGEPLVGDYGVLYRLRVRLQNPTERELTTDLVAFAAGGAARGLFVVDGTLTDIGYLRANEERPIVSFTLAPGAVRDVTIVTMPVAGSFYPVRLTARPRGAP